MDHLKIVISRSFHYGRILESYKTRFQAFKIFYKQQRWDNLTHLWGLFLDLIFPSRLFRFQHFSFCENILNGFMFQQVWIIFRSANSLIKSLIKPQQRCLRWVSVNQKSFYLTSFKWKKIKEWEGLGCRTRPYNPFF